MPRYTIQVYELHKQDYEVEADSLSEALTAYLEGSASMADNTQEFIETDETRGLRLEELPADAAEHLRDHAFNEIIPTIRSIEEE